MAEAEKLGAQAAPSLRTEYAKVDPESPDAEVIARAGEILRRGGLVAFPTETVYGLGGDALSPDASRKIYAAKGRPSDNPLIVHIADMDALWPIAAEVPEAAKRLAAAYWPGPLTMVFPKTSLVPPETSGGLPTVAVRMPSHPVAAALIRAAGGYIAAPSANASGRPSPTRVEHVREDMDGRIDMILDGGPVEIGLESTIVDFTEPVPMILRPGFINLRMLREILGEVRTDPGILSANAGSVRPKAPGMRYRHYAPKAPLLIVEGTANAVTAEINRRAGEDISRGLAVGIIAAAETAGTYRNGLVREIGSRQTEEEIARHLFDVLRGFDEAGVDRIYSEAFDTPKLGMAIMNRLLRAAGHQVVKL